MTILKTADTYTLDIGGAANRWTNAYKRGSPVDMVESAAETHGAVAQLFYYLGTAPHFMGNLGTQIISTSGDVFKTIFPFMAGVSLAIGLAILSIGVGSFFLVKESLALARQIQFLRTIKDPADPAQLLDDLKQKTPIYLERSIPEWLNQKIQGPPLSQEAKKREGILKSILPSDLFEKRKRAKLAIPQIAPAVQLEEVRAYAVKKTVLHVLGIISAVIGIIAGIGVLLALPWIAAIILLAASVAVAIAAYVYKKGVVDNPEGGFSYKNCLPEFILNLPTTISNLGKSLTESIQKHQKEKEEYARWLATPLYIH